MIAVALSLMGELDLGNGARTGKLVLMLLLGLLGLLGLMLVFAVVLVGGDVDLFTAGGRRQTTGSVLLLVDTDLLLELDVAVAGADGLGGEGFKRLFVTFPSDVRSLRR